MYNVDPAMIAQLVSMAQNPFSSPQGISNQFSMPTAGSTGTGTAGSPPPMNPYGMTPSATAASAPTPSSVPTQQMGGSGGAGGGNYEAMLMDMIKKMQSQQLGQSAYNPYKAGPDFSQMAPGIGAKLNSSLLGGNGLMGLLGSIFKK